MANTFKKFLALVLVLSLVMGMTGMAYAADDTTEDAIEDVIDTPVAEDEIIEDEPLPVDNTTEAGTIPTEDGDELETSVVEDVVANDEVATTAEVATADELNAALANNSITLIKLTGDIEVSEQVDITRDLRLNGGGKTLTYTNSDADANTHISALHVYGAKVLISDLSIIHNTGAALIVNGRADVTVDKLTTSAAGTDSRLWGGVNVDGHSRFTAYNLTCNEVSKVWSEDAGKANGSTVSIDGFVTVYGVDGEKVHFTTEEVAENNENIAAKIGDNYYGTLQAAITAATSGQTVTLLNDATESVVISEGQNITLYLNRKTLVNAAEEQTKSGSNPADRHDTIVNNGTLKLVGPGTVDNVSHGVSPLENNGVAEVLNCTIARSKEAGAGTKNDGGNSYYFIKNYGTMTLTNVTAESTGKYSSMVRNGYNNSDGTVGAIGTLTIEENTSLINGNTAVKNECGTLTVNGGVLTSKSTGWSLTNYGTAYLNGGDYTGSGKYAVWTNASDESPNFPEYKAGILTIYGGVFAQNVSKYIAKDYKTLDNNNGTWTVVPNYVARIGNNPFMSLKEAVNAPYASGNTIELLRDTTESVTIPAGVNTTIDLGGHTLTGLINVFGNLTLKNGTLTAAKSNAIQNRSGGMLTIEDSMTINGLRSLYAVGNSTTTINGGTFNGSISSNGTDVDVTITINGGTFNQIIYLPAGGNSVCTINNGQFDAGMGTDKDGNPAPYNAAIELRAGTLNIHGGTFTFKHDTTLNADPTTVLRPSGSGNFRGVILACKHDSSNDGSNGKNSYVGDAIVNIYGGTFTNEYSENSDAIVIADFGKDENNAGKAEVNIHGGSVYGQLSVYRPEGQNEDAKLELTGGDYTGNETEFCANGYRCTQRADQRWIVERIPTTPVTPPTPSTPDEPDEPVVDIEDDPTALGDRPFIFEDVHEQDWFYDDVKNIFEQNLINGTTTTTYEPQTELTRGMIVTILWRIAGEPTVETTSTFADVPENAYYFNAINWGAANNIARGYDEETFAPDRLVSREELAAFIYRYSELIELDLTGIDEEAFAEFGDAESVLPWFVENMKWAISAGIVKGEDGMLLPQDRATRAEAAAMVNRFIQMPEVAAIMQANAEAETATDAE